MEEPPKKKKGPKKLVFPRRQPTLVIPPREIVYVTADKLTCKECDCFPQDEYVMVPKLNPCLKTPLTLYELAAAVVDKLIFPDAFFWSEDEVADWMENEVGLPQYRNCILDNHIDGRRLLMLSDPSHCPDTNIRYFNHIKMVTAKIRELFSIEFIRFSRSVGLPPLKPLTHCTWFKSRTGPPWGIRKNWTRSDIFRWMKIIDPEPVYFNHWDLVWYMKPDFPKTLYARVKTEKSRELEDVPRYIPPAKLPCREYMVPRKYPLHREIKGQKIWMEHSPDSPRPTEHEWFAAEMAREAERKKYKPTRPKPNRLDPPVIDFADVRGKSLILARRLMPKKKFMAICDDTKGKKKIKK